MSSEYGWTDEQIHNTTLERLRQIVATIQQRKFMAQREAKSLISWQTRTLASFIAGGYWTEGENKALQDAKKIHVDEIEELELEEAEELQRDTPADEKNPAGSFESLMMKFAGSSMIQK